MTKIGTIIKSIEEMDIDNLGVILDDDRSYKNLSKSVFLKKLSDVFEECKSKHNVSRFSEVMSGKCAGPCDNKGKKGYAFKAGYNSLNVVFGDVEVQCNDFCICSFFDTGSNDILDMSDLYISARRDEEVDYIQSIEEIDFRKAIDVLYKEFKVFKSRTTVISEFAEWTKKSCAIDNAYKGSRNFEFINEFLNFRISNSFGENIVSHNKKALEANLAYEKLNKSNEKELVAWVLKYKNEKFSTSSFLISENFERNGVIIHKDHESILLDCLDFMDSIKFNEIWRGHNNKLMMKYNPDIGDIYDTRTWVKSDLASYLRWHNKYTDILPLEPEEDN